MKLALRILGWVLCITLVVGATGLGALALGLLASLSGTGPLWLRSLGALTGPLADLLGASHWSGVVQALALIGLTSLLMGLAAYVKPRG
ncbi:hypothetical protein [Deinococcus arboris]|uniref:hypothetical protein n=1 Tax=Deinococcus arboris TaxID=2682977 RepID=UPI0034E21276